MTVLLFSGNFVIQYYLFDLSELYKCVSLVYKTLSGHIQYVNIIAFHLIANYITKHNVTSIH